MKHGDIIVNIDDLVKVSFQGYVAGENCCYNINFDVPGDDSCHKPYKSHSQFTGTVAQVINYTAYLIDEYNRTLISRGGGLVI